VLVKNSIYDATGRQAQGISRWVSCGAFLNISRLILFCMWSQLWFFFGWIPGSFSSIKCGQIHPLVFHSFFFWLLQPLNFSISTLSPSDFCMDLVGREHFTKYSTIFTKVPRISPFEIVWTDPQIWHIFVYFELLFHLDQFFTLLQYIIYTYIKRKGLLCIWRQVSNCCCLSLSVLRPTMLHDLFYSHDCCCLP
jgi:hypothetical protein